MVCDVSFKMSGPVIDLFEEALAVGPIINLFDFPAVDVGRNFHPFDGGGQFETGN